MFRSQPRHHAYSARLWPDALTGETSESKLLDGSTEVNPPDTPVSNSSTLRVQEHK
jgi:hypothetical protein